MAQIQISNLTFSYDSSPDLIFDDVSYSLDTTWKLGFIGRNGRGKTTFLNLLRGIYEYRGAIASPVEFEYFPYHVADSSMLTLDVAMSVCYEAEEWQFMRELNLLETDTEILYRPFEILSQGEKTKVLIAALFLKENRFLLIDEPTNHLDLHGRKVLSNYLKKKQGYIIVSHDRAFLDGCVDHILSINKADIEVCHGNFSTWLYHKDLQDQFELAENEKLKREIGRLEKSTAEKAKWSHQSESRKIGFDPNKVEKNISRRAYIGAKTKKQMRRAKAMEKRRESVAEEKKTLLHNVEQVDALKISPQRYFKERLLTVDDVSLFYGETLVCDGICFHVEQGDRIALQGKNGAGKSSLLKLLWGEPVAYRGHLDIGSRLRISYVSQDTSRLKGNLSVFAEENAIDETLFKTILRHLGFERSQFEKNMADFSGGQKKKVLLAKSMCEKAHLYIWDEPLNYVDVISRMQIEEMILTYQPTMIFVEHDAVFCDKIATDVISILR